MSDDKIRVFLIDDEPLAIKGWKELLSKAGDFQVTGEVSTRKLSGSIKALPQFDIVLAGKDLLDLATRKHTIDALKKRSLTAKIVLIIDNKDDARRAQRAGIDEAIQSPFQSNTLINLLRGLHQEPKKRCAYYVGQLENLRSSNKNDKNYETLMSDILEFLFAPHLTDRYLKVSTFQGERECSLLFLNGGNNPFWERIHADHQAHRLLFDIRNTSPLKPQHVERLGERLMKEIGQIGILVTHSDVAVPIQRLQVALYKNQSKMILFLTNSQIRNMLTQKAAGIDPTELFQDIYEEFITAL
jgi:DNA-binding NarL/FixJ family response regulator